MPTLPAKGAYPVDWPAIARAVKDDAEWRCVRCKAPHNPSDGYTLTVHHFDGDKSNCERWNLMALCQRCHLSVQSRVNPENALLFDPAPWSMPYIAGFYTAGRGVPAPGWDLTKWILEFMRLTKRNWPAWAPWPPDAQPR